MSKNKVIVFDLDDTLYKETDFVSSGFKHIATYLRIPECHNELLQWWREGVDAFDVLINRYSLAIDKNDLLSIYRHHIPKISLSDEVKKVLINLSDISTLGIITDGRKSTQWNKINVLGLTQYIDTRDIIISEEFGYSKPSKEPFEYFMSRYPHSYYCYIGDNLSKDFIAPNSLGWDSICLLDNGTNIFEQDFEKCPPPNLPRKIARHFSDIIIFADAEVGI